MGIDKENFGKRLRQLIVKKGMKYGFAAEKFDISLGYLNKLMNNEREPSLELKQKIAEELSISVPELTGDPIKVPRIGDMPSDEFFVEMSKLTAPETRAEVLARYAHIEAGHSALKAKIANQLAKDVDQNQTKADMIAMLNLELPKLGVKDLQTLTENVQKRQFGPGNPEAEEQVAKLKDIFEEDGFRYLLNVRMIDAVQLLATLRAPLTTEGLKNLTTKLTSKDHGPQLRKAAKK